MKPLPLPLPPALILLLLTLMLALTLSPALAPAAPEPVQTVYDGAHRDALPGPGLGEPAARAHADTVWFGGSGTGNGSIVRGGTWTWETSSGEAPQFFQDGDPVGNQYLDGWTFMDHTASRGPSQAGAPHWDVNGSYDFDNDGGSFAHRATTHANDGENDGPDPLDDPDNPSPSAWSLWIGTNLRLNPEHCNWTHAAGYGNSWSQGFQKSYAIPAGNLGARYDLRFYHRYATEAGYDTNWVEFSLDGLFWHQVGDAQNGNGIFEGGDIANPQPYTAGGTALVNLITWPYSTAGTLYVRFRLSSDLNTADEDGLARYFWAWQVDDVQLLRNGIAQGRDDFETGMQGWQPKSFEGFDFDLTIDPNRPAGRIESLANLSCPPIVNCPDACGLENRVLLFADKDQCDLNDSFQVSRATSKAFAIGGAANPDIDGDTGRLVAADVYFDGGTAGLFATGYRICWQYWPFNMFRCPYTPSAGEPGAGSTFNWSPNANRVILTCENFGNGVGPYCVSPFLWDISALLPAEADSVIISVGAFSFCRFYGCDPSDSGAPFIDNVRFGVFDPVGVPVTSWVDQRYADNYPISNGPITTTTCRTDRSGGWVAGPPQGWVREDYAGAIAGIENTAVFLRWAVERGPCQPNLNHPFFAAFPASAPGSFPAGLLWHAAQMDTLSERPPRTYMTCFHEASEWDGTYWTDPPSPNDWCDDILPDGLFTAGNNVYYFFETRNAATGAVTGTFPFARNRAPIGTTANYKEFWLQSNNLPELTPACDGTYANTMLLVNDSDAGDWTPMRRARLTATLESLGLEFDVYDVVSAGTGYDTIGRREDRPLQQPRPPMNGATTMMLEPYDIIWYSGTGSPGLTDQRTNSIFGGEPSVDQQKLETWLAGCTPGQNRLLVLEGEMWAHTVRGKVNGPAFLANRGVDVLARDYAPQLATDFRRCARLTSSRPADLFDHAEIFGSGCPEADWWLDINVLGTIGNGEAVAHFVESHEGWDDPVNCNDDSPRPAWLAAARRRDPTYPCRHSAVMTFWLTELNPLHCAGECQYDDYRINGENAELVIDFFRWAGMPINASPIGVGEEAAAPRFVNELYQALPNPANPTATIHFTIAERGPVSLRIFDVSGRQVRTLVEQVLALRRPSRTPWCGTAGTTPAIASARASFSTRSKLPASPRPRSS